MSGALSFGHALAAPVLLPLVTAALLIAMGDRWRAAKAAINFGSAFASLALALFLLAGAGTSGPVATLSIYLPGNWPVPYGIVLALDRLSAMMLVLSACTALASLLFSMARWHRAGIHFHALLQLQLMGLNGAFLTADLVNLFVFFEVLLAASYGLLLHGGGAGRVQAGLHYIAINLVVSLIFLVGVAVLYGVTGTLNMADIATKLPQIPAGDRGLLHAGAALLGIAFLVKAALWPLNFWLPAAYSTASAPAAAMFAVLTKVGVYAILRLWTLCFPASAGDSALFGGPALLSAGLVTIAFGAIGMLASQQLARLASFSIIGSSGTVVAAISLGLPDLTGAALFYMASSTLAAASLFLLAELVERARQVEVDPPSLDDREDRLPEFASHDAPANANLDDDQVALVGRPMPRGVAVLGVAFLACTLVLAGLPPLSGFVGKLAMLQALLQSRTAAAGAWGVQGWVLFSLLILSGLLGAVALTRAFISHFWALRERAAPHLHMIEVLPVVLLLGTCVGLSVAGDAALRFTRAAASDLHLPEGFVSAVMRAQPVPPPQGAR